MAPRIVLYTAPGCHLCGPAVDVVRTVRGDDFELVDITTDPALDRRHREHIPVVEIDGVERFWYEVAEEDLRALL